MVRNEHEIVIHCPIERVFQFVADLETWSQWHGGEVEKRTSGPVGVGTVWEATAQVEGRPMVVTVEATSYERNRRFGIKHVSGAIEVPQVFALEPVEAGTRLVTVLELADPEMAQAARQQWERDLLTLKELLEAG